MSRLAVAIGLAASAAALAAVLFITARREPHYPADECTAWAYERRPDLTRDTGGLDAADWEDWARANGYRVDVRPRAGDVAVWDRYVGAGPHGHVAFVETVTRDGGVFVSERNLDECHDVAFVRLTPARQSTALFIHRPAAITLP